jgi:hypothetical protein
MSADVNAGASPSSGWNTSEIEGGELSGGGQEVDDLLDGFVDTVVRDFEAVSGLCC